MLPAAVVLACVLANMASDSGSSISSIQLTSCSHIFDLPPAHATQKFTRALDGMIGQENVQLAHRAYNPTPCTRVCTPIPVDRLKAWQTFSCKVETDSVPGDGLPTWSSWFSSCIRSIRSTQPSDKQPRSFTHSSAVLQLPLLCFLHCLSLIVLALQVLVTVHCKPQTAPKGDPRCVSPP
jgi:hypothetical protein